MIDLTPENLAIVKNIFGAFVPDGEVFVFGSRAKSPAKRHSDLDLVIKRNGALERDVLRKLKTAFEESDLPFRVDIVEWATTKETFRNIIQNEMVKIV